MAERVKVELVDDIDGSEATTKVHFTYGGVAYQIDLNDKNVARFDKAMEPWVSHARKVTAPRAARGGVKSARVGPAPADVRLWASMNGIEVPAKGRVPAGVVEKYEAANG